ncbi:lipid-A-disaccharide synthase [Alphaproteobacteria bacterium]|nr:lipid-A-disaccharide synthase [Alphaproteobacteria bacterium]
MSKVFIVAGEASGDMLGSQVMTALKFQRKDAISFDGIGGPLMEDQGLESLFPAKELSVMGIVEIVRHLPRFYRLYRQTKRAIEQAHPDIIVTIDCPEFSFPIGKWAHRRGYKVHHIVAPSVWAWRPGRAEKIAAFLSKLYCLYPFEPPLFQVYGLDARFVGHPLIDKQIKKEDGVDFRASRGIDKKTPLLCTLLGSREGEIQRLLPVFQKTALLLQKEIPDLHLVLPTVPQVADIIRKTSWACPTLIVTDEKEKYQAMHASNAALAASGTVTLELALATLPSVVAYKVNGLTALIARMLVKTPFVSLPNILLQKQVMPELLQEDCTPEKLAQKLLPLIKEPQKSKATIQQLKAVREKLTAPNGKPSLSICEGILEDLPG